MVLLPSTYRTVFMDFSCFFLFSRACRFSLWYCVLAKLASSRLLSAHQVIAYHHYHHHHYLRVFHMHLCQCVLSLNRRVLYAENNTSLNSRLWHSDRTTRSIRRLVNTESYWCTYFIIVHRYFLSMTQSYASVSCREVCFWIVGTNTTEQTARHRQTTGAEERKYSCVSECVHVRWTVTKVSAEHRHCIVLSALFSWLARLKWCVRHQSFVQRRSVCLCVCL